MTIEETSGATHSNEKSVKELNPWMSKRLEERARPLTTQKLLQLLTESRLTRSVTKHTGLPIVVARFKKSGFLSRAYQNILKRSGNVDTLDAYRMIDLPWFTLQGDENQEPTSTGHPESQIESTRPSINKQQREISKEHTVSQPGKTIITSYINRVIHPPISQAAVIIGSKVGSTLVKSSTSQFEKKVAFDYQNSHENPIPKRQQINSAPGTEAGRSTISGQQKTQIQVPKSINRTSGPLKDAAKSSGKIRTYGDIASAGLDQNRILPGAEARIPDRGKQDSGIHDQHEDLTTSPKSSKNLSGDTRRTSETPHRIGNDKRYLRAEDISPKLIPSETSLKPIQPISLHSVAEKKIDLTYETGISNISENKSGKNQYTKSGAVKNTSEPAAYENTINSNVLAPVQQDKNESSSREHTRVLGDRTSSSPTFDGTHEKKLMEKQPEASDKTETTQEQGFDKEVAAKIYPPQELSYRKPLTFTQRFIQSIPFIRKIKRREDTSSKSPVVEKQYETKNQHFSLTKIDMVHTPVKVEKNREANSDLLNTNLSEPDSLTATGNKPAVEASAVMRQTVDRGLKEPAEGQIYPVQEFIYNNPHPVDEQNRPQTSTIKTAGRETRFSSPLVTELKPKNESKDLQSSKRINEKLRFRTENSRLLSAQPSLQTIQDNDFDRGGDETITNLLSRLPDYSRPSSSQQIDLVLAPGAQANDLSRQREFVQQQAGQVMPPQQSNTNDRRASLIQASPSQSTSQSSSQSTGLSTSTQTETQTSSGQNSENNQNQNNQPDIREIARQVYPLIRRMVIIERERRPSL